MKPELDAILNTDFDNEDLKYEVPEILPTSTAKDIELEWLAGRLAYLFQANKALADSSIEENSSKFKSDSLFLTRSMKNSIILKPSDVWKKDVMKMDGLFTMYNGENSLKNGRGLVSRFHRILKIEFPNYDIEMLKTFAFLRTAIQIKSIKKAVEAKKKSKMTQKGAQKTIRMAVY